MPAKRIRGGDLELFVTGLAIAVQCPESAKGGARTLAPDSEDVVLSILEERSDYSSFESATINGLYVVQYAIEPASARVQDIGPYLDEVRGAFHLRKWS
ncbi:MAG: hypothetical protein JWP44_4500 [Mucilaginibacter sp.]|nr:hypothetical protein [Mucilaginibacter sp.]